ncbi:MAG: hypothetical protein HPZ91_00695 [Lentisphaeria bacterium]|nr:hypothetical protein [Lentisphaeria bacterium]
MLAVAEKSSAVPPPSICRFRYQSLPVDICVPSDRMKSPFCGIGKVTFSRVQSNVPNLARASKIFRSPLTGTDTTNFEPPYLPPGFWIRFSPLTSADSVTVLPPNFFQKKRRWMPSSPRVVNSRGTSIRNTPSVAEMSASGAVFVHRERSCSFRR